MARVYQVIAIPATAGFAVFQFGGRRSTGKNYTRTAAIALKDWLTERDAGYPGLARLKGETIHYPARNCTAPCCRKAPKRAPYRRGIHGVR